MLRMRGTWGTLLPIQEQREKANPMIMYICSSVFMGFEHFFSCGISGPFFLQYLRTSKQIHRIMQMIGICRFSVDSRAWKEGGREKESEREREREREKRIKPNWCGSLLCVKKEIRHFNNCQVHWIKKQADNVLKFNTPLTVSSGEYHFSAIDIYARVGLVTFWWDDNWLDNTGFTVIRGWANPGFWRWRKRAERRGS